MTAQLILAIALLTGGWGPPPAPGPIAGKGVSYAYCISSIGDDPIYQLPAPVCFEDEYYLYTSGVGFAVEQETWERYEIGDSYP